MSVLLNIVNLWLVAQSALVGHLVFLFLFMYFFERLVESLALKKKKEIDWSNLIQKDKALNKNKYI